MAKSIESQFGAYNFSYAPSEAVEFSGFVIYSRAENILEEKNTRRYTVSNALEETSEYTTQENEQQLYKFTTEYINENLQTEYNLLWTSNQKWYLIWPPFLEDRRVPEQIGQYRQQTPIR